MNASEAREEFRQALMAITEVHARRDAAIAQLQVELNQLVEQAALATMKECGKRRGKKPADAILGAERFGEIAAPFRVLASEAYAQASREIKSHELRLLELADSAEVRAGIPYEDRQIADAWTSSYASQGFGCVSYASNDAEGKADVLRAHGYVPTIEVVRDAPRKRHDYGPFGGPTTDIREFRVMLPAAEYLDVEILRRLSPPPFKEEIRACLKRGGNPWVLNPFLPRDIMERLGLDWQGRDATR